MEKVNFDLNSFFWFLFLQITNIIIDGFIIYSFWLWFVAPAINVEPLTYIESIGIGLFAGYMLLPAVNTSAEEFNKQEYTLSRAIFVPLTVFFMGFIFKLFFIGF